MLNNKLEKELKDKVYYLIYSQKYYLPIFII